MTGTNYQKLVKIITPEIDVLWATLKDLRNSSRIEVARGQGLDNLGIWLDLQRLSKDTDEIYRRRLEDVIYVNTIVGTKDAVKQLLADYLGIPAKNVLIYEEVNNIIRIQLPLEYSIQRDTIKKVVARAVAAGVMVDIWYGGTRWDENDWDENDTRWI